MRTSKTKKPFKSPYCAATQAAMKRLCEKCVRVMFDGQLVTAENWDAVLGADTFISFYVMDFLDEFLDICTVIGGQYKEEGDGHKIEYVLLAPPPPIIPAEQRRKRKQDDCRPQRKSAAHP